MAEFASDYYEMNFSDFKEKFERLIGCRLNEKGYIVGNDKLMSIRDLSYFANKEKKFAKELNEGRERVHGLILLIKTLKSLQLKLGP